MGSCRFRPVRAGVLVGLVATLGLTIAACGNVMDAMGLTKKPPDEFVVVTRAPLSLPPDFTLRPPRPGAPRPQEASVQDRAKAALYGDSVRSVRGTRSKGEQALLKRAGATGTRSGIRGTVEREQAQRTDESVSLFEKMIFWNTSESPSEIIDPAKEAERIRQASAIGELPGEGETATIKRSKTTIFDILV